jgi:hypothetical protein
VNTPFDHLGALLDRLHRRSPIAAYFVALAIAAACTLALAYLNADGSHAAASVHIVTGRVS